MPICMQGLGLASAALPQTKSHGLQWPHGSSANTTVLGTTPSASSSQSGVCGHLWRTPGPFLGVHEGKATFVTLLGTLAWLQRQQAQKSQWLLLQRLGTHR